MPQLDRNQVFLAKVESTEGQDASPTASADAVSIFGLAQVTPQPNIIESQENTTTLDQGEPFVGEIPMQLSVPVSLKGSGTAGSAPEWGPLLRACGFAETNQATTIPTTGTSTATGGTATSFDIDHSIETDWPSTAGVIDGMPVTLSNNPATAVTTLITSTSVNGNTLTVNVAHTFGTPLDNTTEAKVELNTRYAPASASIPTLTLKKFTDGDSETIVGCRGDVSISFPAGQVAVMSYTFTGLFSARADEALPSPTLDGTRPVPWRGGLAHLNRIAVGIGSLTLAANNTIAQPGNPNTSEGFDPVVITGRSLQGTIDPLRRLVATDDVFTAFRDGTNVVIQCQNGSTAGNKWGVVIPQAKYRDMAPADREGLATQNIPFQMLGSDTGFFLTLF